MTYASQNPARWLLAVLIGLLAMSLSFSFAAHGLQVAAVADLKFEVKNSAGNDELVKALGIRLELAGGLNVVVTDKAASRIGDVYVPAFAMQALPKNALDAYDLNAAVNRIGVVESHPGGVIFVLKEKHNQKAMTTLMTHLQSIGAQIGAIETGGRAFGFTAEGVAYRAVFSADANGTLVYLGH